jgi:hypothetical protein
MSLLVARQFAWLHSGQDEQVSAAELSFVHVVDPSRHNSRSRLCGLLNGIPNLLKIRCEFHLWRLILVDNNRGGQFRQVKAASGQSRFQCNFSLPHTKNHVSAEFVETHSQPCFANLECWPFREFGRGNG